MRLLRRPLICAALLSSALWVLTGTARCSVEESSEPEIDYPLATVCAASVNRLLGDVDYVFESIGRPELADIVASLMANVNDLRGIDRDRPFGGMVYLPGGFVPEVVAFIPITDLEEFKKTLEAQEATLAESEEDDRFEGDIRGQHFSVRLLDSYALLAQDEAALDRKFPDPAQLTRGIASKYDLGAVVTVKSFSETRRKLFLQLLNSMTMAQLQQRDTESDAVYRRRRSQGEQQLRFFEQLLTDGEDATLGLIVSPDQHRFELEFALNARPGSTFGDYLSALARKRSLFENLVAARSPFSMTISLDVQKPDQKYYHEQLAFLHSELRRILEVDDDAPDEPLINDVFEPLDGTIDRGHLDAIVQLSGKPPGEFILLAGIRVTGGDRLARGVSSVLRRLQPKLQEIVNVSVDAATREGVSFHRFSSHTPIAAAQPIFGNQPSLYVGIAPKAIWLVVGGEDALPVVAKAIETVDDPQQRANDLSTRPPSEMVVHVSQWLGLLGPPESQGRVAKLAMEAFADKPDDAIRVEQRGVENGQRQRIIFEEACVRFLGLQIARRIEGGGD